MQIEFKELPGNELVSASRISINGNFNIAKSAINKILTLIDVDTSKVSGIKSLSVISGTVDITDTLINTNGSISLGGNLICKRNIEAQGMSLSSDLTLTNGNFTMQRPGKYMTLNCNVSIDGETILHDITTAAIDASNITTFDNIGGDDNYIYYPTEGDTIVGGWISPVGRSVITLDWLKFVDTDDEVYRLNVVGLKCGLTTTIIGQTVKIISLIDESVDLPVQGNGDAEEGFWITKDCLEYTDETPIEIGIKFTKAYQSVELIYNGTNWMILNINGAEIV